MSNRYQQLFTGKRLAFCIASIWLTAPILYLPIVLGKYKCELYMATKWSDFFDIGKQMLCFI